MRIQQQFHSLPWNIRSISELPIALKSSGTENRPRRNPSLRTCFPVGVSRAVTLTLGFPALAMMNGFPPAASSTKRESCVLALWMLTVITNPPIELSSLSLVQYGWSVKSRAPPTGYLWIQAAHSSDRKSTPVKTRNQFHSVKAIPILQPSAELRKAK